MADVNKQDQTRNRALGLLLGSPEAVLTRRDSNGLGRVQALACYRIEACKDQHLQGTVAAPDMARWRITGADRSVTVED